MLSSTIFIFTASATEEGEASPSQAGISIVAYRSRGSRGRRKLLATRAQSVREKMVEFKGRNFVNIREYYSAGGDLRPSKTGIMLTLEQWDALKKCVPEVDEAIKRHV